MKTVLFHKVLLFNDPEARSAALNMAMDELLLSAGEPILRVYQWKKSAVSIGYFSPWAAIEHPEFHGWDKVRRWTGGGLVRHDGMEITYALAFPGTDPAAKLRGMEIYRQIHSVISTILASSGLATHLAPKPEGGCEGLACFTNPVEADLISEQGNKIAGAAQRRGRQGLLQQGSIRFERTSDFAEKFAGALADEVHRVDASAFLSEAEALAGKYGSQLWSLKH